MSSDDDANLFELILRHRRLVQSWLVMARKFVREAERLRDLIEASVDEE